MEYLMESGPGCTATNKKLIVRNQFFLQFLPSASGQGTAVQLHSVWSEECLYSPYELYS